MRISDAERTRLFGSPCQSSRFTVVTTPWGMRATVHKLIEIPFLLACTEAYRTCRCKPLRVDSFNCRKTRGGSGWSLHAYALAHDWFLTGPGIQPAGGVWTPTDPITPDFAACFTRRGFTWGATFTRGKDVPHIEWADRPPRSMTAQAAAAGEQVTATAIMVGAHVEEDGMKPIDVRMRLDDQGRGWATLERIEAAKVQSFVPLGPYPEIDGYWETPVWARQQRGPNTIVSCTEGPPKGDVAVTVWVAD